MVNDARSTGEIQYHANVTSRCQSLRKICHARPLPVYVIRACVCVETLCTQPQQRIKDESRGRVSRDAAEESSSRTSLFRNRTQSERLYALPRSWMLLTARIRASGNPFANNFLDVVTREKSLSTRFESFTERGKLKRNSRKNLKTRYNIIGMFLAITYFRGCIRSWKWKILIEESFVIL